MKKLLLATVLTTILLTSSAMAEDTLIFDTEESTLVLKKVDATLKNLDGVDSVLLDMVATLKTEEPNWPANFIRIDVFQGGKTLDSAVIPSADNPYGDISRNDSTKLKNGASVEYYKAYTLDSREDLEIIFREFSHMDVDYTLYYSLETGEISYESPEPLPDYKALYEELLEKYNALLDGDN